MGIKPVAKTDPVLIGETPVHVARLYHHWVMPVAKTDPLLIGEILFMWHFVSSKYWRQHYVSWKNSFLRCITIPSPHM